MDDRLALLADAAVVSAIGLKLGRGVEYHARIDSTQDRARELATNLGTAITVPGVVVANEQLAGRGTGDRVWVAPSGTSLLASWIFPLAASARSLPGTASLLAGVAVVRALDALGVTGSMLKWPNDVQFAGRKAAGVLAHATSGGLPTLVIGIGINVHQSAEEFPEALRKRSTSLALEDGRVDRLELLSRLTRELVQVMEGEDPTALPQWRSRSTIIGKQVLVERPGGPSLSGVALDLAPDGALLIQTAYGPERILAGEVTVSGE